MAKRNKPETSAPAAKETEWEEDNRGAAEAEQVETPANEESSELTPAADSKEKPLPNDVRECFAMLKELENMPEHKRHLAEAKAAKMAPIKAHIARLQQGPAAPHIESNAYGHAVGGQRDLLKRARWESLARLHPEVKELLSERDTIAKELETLKTSQK